MSEKVCARAISEESANLTMTKEYLVVNGKHFELRNNYLSTSTQALSISVKNILNMECLTIRSKRLLMVFMILMTIVIFGGVGVHKLLSFTRQIDRKVQKIENVYNYVADEDVDINITGSLKSGMSKLGVGGIMVLYVSLVIGSIVCLLFYVLKPFRVLYISTLGKIIAVERKFYDKAELNAIVNEWKRQL